MKMMLGGDCRAGGSAAVRERMAMDSAATKTYFGAIIWRKHSFMWPLKELSARMARGWEERKDRSGELRIENCELLGIAHRASWRVANNLFAASKLLTMWVVDATNTPDR